MTVQRPSHRATGIAVLLVVACSAIAVAQPIRRVDASLQGQPTTFQPAAGPSTRWQAAGPDSSFGPAASPDTFLRLAEVPAARMAATRTLLTELKAEPGPAQSIALPLPADLLFEFDRADLKPAAEPTLQRVRELMASYADAPIRVEGHTDAKGSDRYNDALSLRRAQAVAAALQPSAAGRAVAVQGHGSRHPLAVERRPDGSDDAGARQRNRRVSVLIERAPAR